MVSFQEVPRDVVYEILLHLYPEDALHFLMTCSELYSYKFLVKKATKIRLEMFLRTTFCPIRLKIVRGRGEYDWKIPMLYPNLLTSEIIIEDDPLLNSGRVFALTNADAIKTRLTRSSLLVSHHGLSYYGDVIHRLIFEEKIYKIHIYVNSFLLVDREYSNGTYDVVLNIPQSFIGINVRILRVYDKDNRSIRTNLIQEDIVFNYFWYSRERHIKSRKCELLRNIEDVNELRSDGHVIEYL